MFRILSQLTILLFSLPALAYYGGQSTEVMLRFTAKVDVPLYGNPSVKELNQSNSAARQRALTLVDAQIQHLMGHFQAPSYLARYKFAGALGEKYNLRFTNNEPTLVNGKPTGRNILTYEYSGRMIFRKDMFSRGPVRNDVPIRLPLSPDLIYDQTKVQVTHAGVKEWFNPCTDHHYNTAGDFWYFWDPEYKNCSLQSRPDLMVFSQGQAIAYPNSTNTYPEYDQLYRQPKLRMVVLLGYIDDLTNLRRAKRKDDAFKALLQLHKRLSGYGFKNTFNRDDFRFYSDGRIYKGINFHHRYESVVESRLGKVPAQVDVFLGDTAIDSKDWTFQLYWKEALENASIIIYDGHSGLGGNLDLALLRPQINIPKNKYQIIFFNGCSSYPYFKGMYLDAKGGPKFLDVVTSGLPTMTDTMESNISAFLHPFLSGYTTSWQHILSDLERSNRDNGTYLTGVSGEEGNQWHP